MTDFVQVMTTVGKKEEGQQLARLLVEKKLAACVQIVGPITSVYHWQGNIETAGEFLLFIKSSQKLYAELEAVITANHPYEVPEILAMPVADGGKPYLDWLAKELR